MDVPGHLSHLDQLEAEAIFIMREVAACYDNPCLFYSIGKDSTVMLHLARKAFWPGTVPFTLLHIDTTWEFAEMGRFRDRLVDRLGLKLAVWINEQALREGVHPIESGSVRYNDQMKTQALKQALDHYQFDAALGGARRDEEASRSKERIFSVRNQNHQWDPKRQRPEPWNLFNTSLGPGESVRVFPLSNWTEFDIWLYILREQIEVVPLYLARSRLSWIDEDSGQILALDDDRMLPYLSSWERDSLRERNIRFRTLGCYPQTGAVESDADTVSSVVQEMLASRTSEREGRLLDKDQTGSMEKKKREGYF
ncbi:sulfate adenylyltransferase subunit 2 [Tamilnaduibacter salinus]|uniref:Sulfate adenylyltransferase subunit 2 n=1 Tax=Tamilnaduibacter salinus TaxID=1484056 RepID=A0A2A2I2L9_9GAMM|nr:sulfate adenylyltransferase subunit CysD [Tamilnaduibacter salinus]PAV25385.1 sulfate adenylyltransferase small subunit [Tamilnaduibacter salinus]PVY76412.1 sulfate adenylyltransferase subunit 2 [Tamilnaduibacter salinus]